MIRGLFKALLVLVFLAAIGLGAYAYVGPVLFPQDFAAPARDMTAPVTLDLN